MKIDQAGSRLHHFRAQQYIEDDVALEVVEEETQNAFAAKAGIATNEPLTWIDVFSVEELGDSVTCRLPMFQGGVDTARCNGRYHAGGIAYQHHAPRGHGAHD